MDRYVGIQQALDDLGIVESDIQGGAWVDGELTEGKISDETLDEITVQANKRCSNGKPRYTSYEVEYLLILHRQEVSLTPMPIAGPERDHRRDGRNMSDGIFGIVLASAEPMMEERIDCALVGQRLMKIVRQFTTNEEYMLMELRYGMGAVRGFKTVAEQYGSATGKPMNKGKVAHIEHTVLVRLRAAITKDADLARSFKELMGSLA